MRICLCRKKKFLKSQTEAAAHGKVLLEDKDISPKTQRAFEKLCGKYDEIISKNSGDIGKTMLVKMEIDTGNHPPHHIQAIHPTTETLQMVPQRNRNSGTCRHHRKKHLTMGITNSHCPQKKCLR